MSRQKYSSGQIINMISSDLSRLEQFLFQGAYIISGPVQIISILALLIFYIGPSALAGFGLLIVMLPVQAFIFLRLARLRRTMASITDERIRLTQEFLTGIRIIKFFAWEEKFIEHLMDYRAREVSRVKYLNIWTAVLMGIANTIPVFASVISFIVFVSVGNELSAPIIFPALSLFTMMRFPLIIFPNVIRGYAETKIAMKRLSDYLNASELTDGDLINTKPSSEDIAIEIENGNFQWEILPEAEKEMKDKDANTSKGKEPAAESNTKDNEKDEVEKVDAMDMKPVKTEDHIHLRNINVKLKKGQLVAVVGSVGSGKSTLLNSLLGEVKRTSGEVRITGSIGYSLQQPWILNGTVRQNVTFGNEHDEIRYQSAIKASALERDLEWLPGGSDTLLGEKGIQASGGQRARVSLARVVYCSPDIVLLDDPLSAVDVHVGKHIFKQCIKKSLKGKTVILVTHHLNYLKDVDYILYMKEGEIIEQGSFDELMAANGECARVVQAFAGSDGSDTDVSKNTQEKEKEVIPKEVPKMLAEERLIGAVSPEVYKEYIGSAGGPVMLTFVLCITVFTQCARIGNDLWLSFWTMNSIPALNNSGYAGVYFAWGAVQGLTTSLLGGVLAIAFAIASNKFHRDAIYGVFRAPVTFFDTTPLGRIVNRFSKDTDAMDTQLPMTMQMFLSIFSGLLGTLGLLLYGTPWIGVPLLPLLVVYYFMQRLYMRNSRELKRLESISRSPVISHFSESMTGLSTIRAYRRQDQFFDRCLSNIDVNNQVVYLQLMVQRWLGLRLEILGALICFFAAIFSVLGRDSIPAAIVGVTLTYSLQVTGSLNFAVRQAVEVEVNSNSIERLHHYSKKLDREAEFTIPNHRPSESWPNEGKIDLQGLELKYNPAGPAVLKGVSASIKAREKIGVVGRTGAGKSTVTLGLFRMLEPASGQIIIDDLNISTIGLHDLRSRLAIIPQDPILFSGTVRSNLDPFNNYTDKDIWDVLGGVNMREAISKLKEGLESKVDPMGENFSTGQRQLLCLARAMLRKPRVLIMDEATANVDMESDQLIQVCLRKDFTNSTIITIAHRLNTVIDYDRILVLDRGEIKEFDSPSKLLDNPDGLFARMVDNTGSLNSALLRKLALEKEQKGNVDVSQILTTDIVAE